MINTITLTSQSGKTVSLLVAPQQVEFLHLNGTAEPLITVTVPQDTYVSATATVGESDFYCVTFNDLLTPSGLIAVDYSYGATPDSSVTVILPAQVALSGKNMGLLLNLQVSQSASYTKCHSTEGVANPFTITPTFSLTAIDQSTQSPGISNGKMNSLDGIVASVDTANGSFVVTGADGLNWDILNGNYVYSKALVWRFNANSTTTFQGISGLSTLTVGMPVDIDAQLQTDGSLLANRVGVPDTNTANLTLFSSLNTEVLSDIPDFVGLTRLQEGLFSKIAFPDGNHGPLYGGDEAPYSIDGAVFQISGRLNNLANLPFTPSFTAGTMVAGQSMLFTSHATSTQPSPVYLPVATVTLMPQVVNGTVQSISQEKGFTAYTISLAPYDLFPDLAFTDAYQTSPLTTPSIITVYADSNASMLYTSPAAVGSVLRFNGLVFNDHGALKMDCDQILDGVPY